MTDFAPIPRTAPATPLPTTVPPSPSATTERGTSATLANQDWAAIVDLVSKFKGCGYPIAVENGVIVTSNDRSGAYDDLTDRISNYATQTLVQAGTRSFTTDDGGISKNLTKRFGPVPALPRELASEDTITIAPYVLTLESHTDGTVTVDVKDMLSTTPRSIYHKDISKEAIDAGRDTLKTVFSDLPQKIVEDFQATKANGTFDKILAGITAASQGACFTTAAITRSNPPSEEVLAAGDRLFAVTNKLTVKIKPANAATSDTGDSARSSGGKNYFSITGEKWGRFRGQSVAVNGDIESISFLADETRFSPPAQTSDTVTYVDQYGNNITSRRGNQDHTNLTITVQPPLLPYSDNPDKSVPLNIDLSNLGLGNVNGLFSRRPVQNHDSAQ